MHPLQDWSHFSIKNIKASCAFHLSSLVRLAISTRVTILFGQLIQLLNCSIITRFLKLFQTFLQYILLYVTCSLCCDLSIDVGHASGYNHCQLRVVLCDFFFQKQFRCSERMTAHFSFIFGKLNYFLFHLGLFQPFWLGSILGRQIASC